MLSQIDIQKFNTLIEINTLINSNYQDAHSLVTQILDSATRLCECESSSLLLLDQDAGELYFDIALGSKGAEVKRFTVKLEEGIAGWVVRHNKPVIINDVVNDKRHLQSIAQQIDYPSRTMMAVPMRVKDQCIGVIELINKKNDLSFIQDDLEWLEIFANQAALAIVNAQSIESARNTIQHLQDQLKTDQGYHTMITKSPIMVAKLEIVERIAKTDSSVLILGESGVGKELFAEQIHLRSLRSTKPFIRINCAALPEGLLESELFGHVKGAFTNAITDRRGRFELAEGGTIFLDEIGDLALPLQAKLLRVIQEKTFERVGSETSITVNVRILAATNKDIEALVAEKKFRNDLYYRLNVLPLYIPPLRQRSEDIPELAAFFLSQGMLETKKQFAGFSPEAMDTMLAYSWPGNIRELENCIERACVIGQTQWIQAEDLFLKKTANPLFQDRTQEEGSRDLKSAITAFKAYFIKKVLEEHQGNQTETAKALDIQRTYLSKLIKELDIRLS